MNLFSAIGHVPWAFFVLGRSVPQYRAAEVIDPPSHARKQVVRSLTVAARKGQGFPRRCTQ